MANTFSYWWYQLIYGKYSSKINEYCQQKDLPTPYKLCFAEDPIDHVYEVLNINEKIPVYQTSKTIKFENFDFLIPLKKILKHFGTRNSYSVMKIENYDLKAFCYKKILKGYKVKFIFFFYNDLFFMGQYTFSDYSVQMIRNVSKLFQEKFGIQVDSALQSYYVEDKFNKRFLFLDTGFSIICKFISLENEMLLEPIRKYYKPEIPEINQDWTAMTRI